MSSQYSCSLFKWYEMVWNDSIVVKEGTDHDYDHSLKSTADCVDTTKTMYEDIVSSIRSLSERFENKLPRDVQESDFIAVPEVDMLVDLRLLNEDTMLKGQNAIAFLTQLRGIYKKTTSTEKISLKGDVLELQMKEGYTVTVRVHVDAANHYSIVSATVDPSYPCFQEAIEYSIKRNDIQLLVFLW